MTIERDLIAALVADIASALEESLDGFHATSRETLLGAMQAGNAFLATPVAPVEPITVEAVAEVRSTAAGLALDWLIEGGIDAMVPGCVLVCATRPITDDDGQGEVYLAPVAPALVPLTDERLKAAILHMMHTEGATLINVAREVERLHGIKP